VGVKSYLLNGRKLWQLDIRVTLQDGREKRIRKKGIPTKEMARALEGKLRARSFEKRNFQVDRSARLTVKDLWEAYFPITKRDNDSWRDDVGRANHLLQHVGHRKVMDLSLKEIDAYRIKRTGEVSQKTGRFPAIGTINREFGLLKRMINYAVKCGELNSSPIAHIRMMTENNIRCTTISDRQFAALHEAAYRHLKPILVLAYDCGMRKQEILRLKWRQIDLDDGIISLGVEDTKTNQARKVFLTDRALAELKLVYDGPRHISGYVFVNSSTGRPFRDVKRPFETACINAGIGFGMKNGVVFHDLRRSFVTRARKMGIPESVVMEMSGHRSQSVFKRYNIVDGSDVRSAVNRMNKERRKQSRKIRGDKGQVG
jgi:integrase